MNTQERPQESQEIVVVPNQTLADVTDDILAVAERRVGNLEKIITLSLRITNHQDWVDQNGKPYLMGSGAEKVARLFGVSWDEPRVEKILSKDEKDNFYFYKSTSIFRLGKDNVGAVGTCSSRDNFFARQKGADGKPEYKPLSEIDEMDILKKAVTNCIVNGVTRLLGLRNLTWEQVEGGGKIKKGEVGRVSYGEGGAGGGKISEPQQKRLFAILMLGAKTQEEKAEREAKLKTYLEQTFKISTSKELGWKQYDSACKQAEEIAMEFNER